MNKLLNALSLLLTFITMSNAMAMDVDFNSLFKGSFEKEEIKKTSSNLSVDLSKSDEHSDSDCCCADLHICHAGHCSFTLPNRSDSSSLLIVSSKLILILSDENFITRNLAPDLRPPKIS